MKVVELFRALDACIQRGDGNLTVVTEGCDCYGDVNRVVRDQETNRVLDLGVEGHRDLADFILLKRSN